VSKNAEFDADFESIEKILNKFHTKKGINKNVTELCSFFTFIHVRQFLLLKFLDTFEKYVFGFFEPFRPRFEKSANKSQNIFLNIFKIGIKKRRISC
jgi:hypothetical protein